MKTPSVDVKLNAQRVRTHWSVYAHYVSLPLTILFFILGIANHLEIVSNANSLLVLTISLAFGGLYKITEPIKIPDGTIESQINFAQNSLKIKRSDISFISKGLLFFTIWCLVAFLYPLI